MWAPDITHHNGMYYLYYSVSDFGRNTSAIGVLSNPTLHPNDPDYEWTDHGEVVRSVPGRNLWNAIDPNISFDDSGTPWMTLGSFWKGMKLVIQGDENYAGISHNSSYMFNDTDYLVAYGSEQES